MMHMKGVAVRSAPNFPGIVQRPDTARICTYETGYSRGHIIIDDLAHAQVILDDPDETEAVKGCARVYIEHFT